MADDIDDLLNEVETKFLVKNKSTASDSKAANGVGILGSSHYHKEKSSKNVINRKDDIDDLLNELDFEDEAVQKEQKKSSVKKESTTSLPSQKTKCFPVFIGGSSCPQGQGTTVNRRCCDKLRCTDCDFQVCSFDNVQWHSSTDYLFLRNNMPDYQRLKSKLTSKKGSRAYSCQCKWKSTKDFIDLQRETDLKWVCGKH